MSSSPILLALQKVAPSATAPATGAEVGECVRQAAASGQAIYPVGGQTELHLGALPTRPGMRLDTRRLDQVMDYPARDMTITVQAGMTLGRLQAILAGEKQRLPIDVPHAEWATIGGILATNASGPRRFGWGTLRDYVIGISVVNDEGHEVKAGGRVVKNVAGYDMCKLYIGSLGTLGVITQVTFKLRPVPAEPALFGFCCRPDEIAHALQQIHTTQTRPVCVELLNPAAAQKLAGGLHEHWPSEWTVVLGFEDNADALRWQVRQIVQELGSHYSLSGVLGSCCDPLWRGLVEFPGECDGSLSFKAGVPAAAVPAFCTGVAALLEPMLMEVHAGNGIVVGHCQGDDPAAKVKQARELASAAGGHLVVTRCAAELQTADFVWGPADGCSELMRETKRRLDPRGLFNPGRFVGGI